MATVEEFASVMKFMKSAVGMDPKKSVPHEQQAAYLELLGDLPAEVLLAAAKRAVLEHSFPTLPPVGMIRRHATALNCRPELPLADAFEAARKFAAAWYPWLCDGLPTDPKTRARFDVAWTALPELSLRAGAAYGWPDLATTPAGIAFPHFRALYESVAGPQRADAALPPGAKRSVIEAAGRIEAMPALPSGVDGRG